MRMFRWTLLALLALVALEATAQSGRPFRVEMTGAAERPGPGDPDGSGVATFRVNPGTGEICYTLTVENIATATAAHIHRGGPEEPGPVVVPLEAPSDGSSEGCVTVDVEIARAIVQDPGEYYVNVHNADYGPGAVRGQLSDR
jgi:hypothetical protein